MGYRRHGVQWLAGAVLAALAATPARAAADDAQYAPSATNGCGRLKLVSLPAIASTHLTPAYPEDARQRGQKGHVLLRVLVDKYGFVRNPELVVSSGYAQLDQASIDAVKDRWRWEPPPPECAETDVITSVVFNWDFVHKPGDTQPDLIYLDSPSYPAQARAKKLSGEGKVEYTISGDNKVTDARVTASTGSPDLDAAMLAKIRTIRFPYGVASTTFTASQRFEFVPRDDPDTFKALMGPAIIPNAADLPGKPAHFTIVDPYPAPSRANHCGRTALVFLEAAQVNVGPRYPIEAMSSGKQGRTVVDLLVGESGTVSEATVAESSGSPILDEAAVRGMKGLYHYQAPPPECADQGVRLRDHVDWGIGSDTRRIMAGDPAYPADAVAAKLSGSGAVQITRGSDGDLVSTKVLISTGSPVLNAAMVKYVTDMRFTPGTKEFRRPSSASLLLDFVGDLAAMRAAVAAPVRRVAPMPPPPSAANECGRGGDVFLAPVDSSHVLVPIPMVAVGQPRRTPRYDTTIIPASSFRAQGAMKMQVLVDKDGKAASVTVAASSAPPEMERAVTGTVKESYRWAPPPPECADRGVMLNVNYIYTEAPEKFQIYADDLLYPEVARARSMGAQGMVEVRYDHDKIGDAKAVMSAGSPELDAAMIRVVSDRLRDELRANPQPSGIYITQVLPVMFMPAFVTSPAQRTAQRLHEQAAAPQPP